MLEETLHRREARVWAILEAIPDDLMLLDAQGHILEYKAGSRDSHLPMDRFLGTDIAELFAPSESGRLLEAIQTALSSQQAQVLELPVEGRYFEARMVLMEPGLALVLFRDVSAEKEAERLKREFLALVSHELKTPLTAILGFTELLLGGQFSSVQLQDFLKSIHYSTLRLSDMVNNLLDTSRLEAGRFEVNRRPSQLEAILEEVAQSFEGIAKLRHIHLELELSPLPSLQADPERMAQVLGNLLSNAFKFCPPGGKVWLRAREDRAPQPPGVLLEVEDTGPGIPPDQQQPLFSRYGRTRRALEQGIGGTGLGLYISKAIVEAHGGHIWLEATPGAKFCVWLPI